MKVLPIGLAEKSRLDSEVFEALLLILRLSYRRSFVNYRRRHRRKERLTPVYIP
jgi:hypothetical protein